MPHRAKNGCLTKIKTQTYAYMTKHPFRVGIARHIDDGAFYLLLSGNPHTASEYGKDHLPDWVAMARRPNRSYHTLETDEIVELWRGSRVPNNDPCMHQRSFKVCHPNGVVNYYLDNGECKSQAVEILEASVDDEADAPTLVLVVKPLHKGDNRTTLDGLVERMYDVSLVVDSRKR